MGRYKNYSKFFTSLCKEQRFVYWNGNDTVEGKEPLHNNSI